MALVVEDGTGLPNANSYVSTAEVDTYFADRGDPAEWTGSSQAQKEAACIEATQYSEMRFVYLGVKGSSDQALLWPREYVYDERGNLVSGVPSSLKKTVSEYALRARQNTNGELMPDPTGESAAVRRERSKVGSLEEETEYATPADPAAFKPYPFADRILLIERWARLKGSRNRVTR